MTWDWPGPDPDHWDINYSADGIIDGGLYDTEPGFRRSATPGFVSGAYFNVTGKDSGGSPVTPSSTWVLCP
jgi:hypothetical protein